MKSGAVTAFLGGRVVVLQGDITRERVHAIVNAANSTLLGGGGVDGAIHRAGGPVILQECSQLRRSEFPNGLPPGQAAITSAGKLPCRHVIHTVGPVYGMHEGREAELLRACYINPLKLAEAEGLSSIAFPAISTGAFGYPAGEAARISSLALRDFFKTPRSLTEARLIFFSKADLETFLWNNRFEPEK